MDRATSASRASEFIRSGIGHERGPEVWSAVGRTLAGDLDDIIRALRTKPDIASLISGDDQVAALKTEQSRRWEMLFAETPPAGSGDSRVGPCGAEPDLPPHWKLAMDASMLARIIPRLTARHRFSKRRLDQTLQTLIARVFLDIIVSDSASVDAAVTERGDDLEPEHDILNLRNLAGTVVDVNEVAIDLAYLANNTVNVTGSAQTISAAAAELVASVDEIARNSDGAATDATATDATVTAGRQAVAQVNAAIGNIAAAVEETSAGVDELSRASEQIGQILTVIEIIAGQTNLLALNATIEAARAGEAGKGFAVVATEVKSLATQTSRSTEDITERIASLRSGMNVILTTMQRSKSAVTDGQEAIAQAASTMDRITDQVSNVSTRMQGIADILRQQKGASAEIARSIDRVATTSTENETLLVRMSTKLHDSNDRFSDNAKSWFKADSHRALCEMAKIDHVLFKKRVVDVLMGRGAWAAGEVPDHHNCRLGKWYDGVQPPEIKALAAFRHLVEPHARVHATAKAALTAHARGDTPTALRSLTDMNDASHEVLRLLDELSEALHGSLARFDRRKHARVAASGELTAEIEGTRRIVMVRDVSEGGAGIEGLTRADVGKTVVLGDGDRCGGTAVWSDGRAGGVRFSRLATPATLERLAGR